MVSFDIISDVFIANFEHKQQLHLLFLLLIMDVFVNVELFLTKWVFVDVLRNPIIWIKGSAYPFFLYTCTFFIMYIMLCILSMIEVCSFQNWQNHIKSFKWRRKRAMQKWTVWILWKILFSPSRYLPGQS